MGFLSRDPESSVSSDGYEPVLTEHDESRVVVSDLTDQAALELALPLSFAGGGGGGRGGGLTIRDCRFEGDMTLPRRGFEFLTLDGVVLGGTLFVPPESDIVSVRCESGCCIPAVVFLGDQRKFDTLTADRSGIRSVKADGVLRNLRYVFLRGNGLTDYALMNTPSLHWLDLQDNLLTDLTPKLPRASMRTFEIGGNPAGLRVKHLDFAFASSYNHGMRIVKVEGEFLERLYGWLSEDDLLDLYDQSVKQGLTYVGRFRKDFSNVISWDGPWGPVR